MIPTILYVNYPVVRANAPTSRGRHKVGRGAITKRQGLEIKQVLTLADSIQHSEPASPTRGFPEATLPEDQRQLKDLYRDLICAIILLRRNYILQQKIDDAQREAHRILSMHKTAEKKNSQRQCSDDSALDVCSEVTSTTTSEMDEDSRQSLPDNQTKSEMSVNQVTSTCISSDSDCDMFDYSSDNSTFYDL